MTTTFQTVWDIAPELKEEPRERVNLFIDFAKLSVSQAKFADKYDLAVAVMTAHLLTLASRGGVGGPITQERVGDLSRSYGASQPSNDMLDDTAYGRWFKQLRRSLVITPLCL